MFLKGSLEQMTDEFLLIEWAQVASATLNSDIIYQKKGVAHVPIPQVKC